MKSPEQELDTIIKEVIGNDAVALVQYIRNKLSISEFTIAEVLNLNVNQVRNILYRLNNYGLVSFTRKKDKKKGWYIYYWVFSIDKAKELLLNVKHKQLESLKAQLSKLEKEHYFLCPNSCQTLTFEHALEHQFKCTECGLLLQHSDTEKESKKIKEQITQLEDELSGKLTQEFDEWALKIKQKLKLIKKSKKLKKKKLKKPIKKVLKKKISKKKKLKKRR